LTSLKVPFFRPSLGEAEIQEVSDVLRSGWLTTGPRVQKFERTFAAAVGATHAVSVNSCTAALHLAVEALELRAGQAVIVPTMTFAATAEVIRYMGAIPILADCDPVSGNMSLADVLLKLELVRSKRLLPDVAGASDVVGMMPVHVGGLMMDMDEVHACAADRGLWVVEDAAHAFPASWRKESQSDWRRCGEATAAVSCFSFYANKTITTGEGGMAVTEDQELAERMRLMSLHGLSQDAWGRYSGGGWDYRIIAPGYKYNLTDIAAAIGIHQLARAEQMRQERERTALLYMEALADLGALELPSVDENRIHSWHLFPLKLQLDRLSINRDEFIVELKQSGVGCSVHWRPLHLHPYYRDTYGWRPEDFPVASSMWERLVSLPIFYGMTGEEIECVIQTVRRLCKKHAR
jgi:dTDP-4-amino-4,6-dideoxygalactose transaminase